MHALERVLNFLQDLQSHLEGTGDLPEPHPIARFALQRTTPHDLQLCTAIVETELELWENSGLHVRPALHPYVAERLGVYTLDDELIGRFLDYPDCCVDYFLDGHTRYDHDPPTTTVLTEGFVPCRATCDRAHRAHLLETTDDPAPYRELERELERALQRLGVPSYHSAYEGFYEIHAPERDRT